MLHLPPSSKIRNVFHISLLKPATGTSIPPLSIPSQLCATWLWRLMKQGVRPSSLARVSDIEVLIKWKALPDVEATWEDYNSLLTLFPLSTLRTRWQRGRGVMLHHVLGHLSSSHTLGDLRGVTDSSMTWH